MFTQNFTNIKEFRENLSSLLHKVKSTREPLAVVRHGRPMVVVIPSEEYDEIERVRDYNNSVKRSRKKNKTALVQEVDNLYKEVKTLWKNQLRRPRPSQEDIDAHVF